jgi:hypothetical protein
MLVSSQLALACHGFIDRRESEGSEEGVKKSEAVILSEGSLQSVLIQ